MQTATELRKQVESALADRIPSALSLRLHATPELLSCGLAGVDAVLGGGLPFGAITELSGTQSSGRTTLVLSTLAEVMRQEGSCTYVDASDTFHPASAAAMGVDLHRLLWVRTAEPRNRAARARAADVAEGPPFPVATPAHLAVESRRIGSTGWCHPRNETIGLHHAVGELFQTVVKEKVDFTPRCAEAIRRPALQAVTVAPFAVATEEQGWPQQVLRVRREHTWTQLDQALRATDLLLSTGGFRALVLDMGDVAPEQARRIPLATWYRFRLQAEKSRTLFLLITKIPCANSCAALSLHCSQGSIEWQQATQHSPRLLAGLGYRVQVERNRNSGPTRKKPSAFAEATWCSPAPWACHEMSR